MGLLISCWFIIETILIPGGFAKWQLLSFFVHPTLLVVCQLFLLAKVLVRLVLIIVVHPLKVLFHAILVVFRSLTSWVLGIIPLVLNLVKTSPVASAEEDEHFHDCDQSWPEDAAGTENPTRSLVPCVQWYEDDQESESPRREIVLSGCYCRSLPTLNACLTVQQCYSNEVFQEDGCLEQAQVEDKEEAATSYTVEEHHIKDCSSILHEDVLPDSAIGREEELIRIVFPTFQIDGIEEGGKELSERGEDEHDDVVFSILRGAGVEGFAQGPFPALVKCDADQELGELREVTSSISQMSWNQNVADAANSHQPPARTLSVIRGTERDEPHDIFYKEYMERMGWFDRLNYERTCEASAILNVEMEDPRFLENIEAKIRSIQGTAIQNLMSSIESDLERVYVAHSCLGWEALHHQYRLVEALVSPSSSGTVGVSRGTVTGKFQQFQVHLERYMENECKGIKRFWNYCQSRFSYVSLLRVPEVSGAGVNVGDDLREETTTNINDTLAALEKAIQVFSAFLESDNCRPSGKLKKLLWFDSQVEDPRDLDLFDKLKKEGCKKEKQLKDLQRTSRRWWKKTTPLESQGMDILLSMIDVKLVSRVLRTSAISTQQLRWCEAKLKSIEIKKGKVLRSYNSMLFPSS
uniref:Coagulation factor VIII n=1 Tax=Anthurium amnicola TaxID=1678845 RepID=A0A1D1XUX9_9ARAE